MCNQKLWIFNHKEKSQQKKPKPSIKPALALLDLAKWLETERQQSWAQSTALSPESHPATCHTGCFGADRPWPTPCKSTFCICFFQHSREYKYWNDYSGRARSQQLCSDRWSPTSTTFLSNNLPMPKPNSSNFVLPPVTPSYFHTFLCNTTALWSHLKKNPPKKDTKWHTSGDNSWQLCNLVGAKVPAFPST